MNIDLEQLIDGVIDHIKRENSSELHCESIQELLIKMDFVKELIQLGEVRDLIKMIAVISYVSGVDVEEKLKQEGKKYQ